jgi:hypothetical protein
LADPKSGEREEIVERIWDVPDIVYDTKGSAYSAQQKLALENTHSSAPSGTHVPEGVEVNLPMGKEMIPNEKVHPVITYVTDPTPLALHYRQNASGDWEAYIPAHELTQTTVYEEFDPIE